MHRARFRGSRAISYRGRHAAVIMTRARLTRGTIRATTWASRLGHCADMNGAPLTRTPPRRSWGRGPPPTGWRRIQARRATCLLRVFYCELCSAPTGRVPGLRGAFIIASTPSLLCWFRGPTSRYCCAVECLDSVAFLTYLLTTSSLIVPPRSVRTNAPVLWRILRWYAPNSSSAITTRSWRERAELGQAGR